MNTVSADAVPKANLDQLCVNTIRFLSLDAVEKAASGHPGLPLGAAPMAYVLWTRFLKHNPANPKWFDRDRFVLSAGHGSMLLYSLLHLTGYDLPLEQIRQFRQWGSVTAGHPEYGLAQGVEVTTGPLGQGFADGVGMAIAEAHLAALFNRPGHPVIDHYTYAIVSDGDLMEGIASEAASLAGHLKLGKLIYLYDDNRVTLASAADVIFTEDVAKRFEAYGWHTQHVPDGNDMDAIDAAIRAARDETERPSLILVRTHLGYGAPHKQDTPAAHGSPLGAEEVKLTKQNLGWPEEPAFFIPPEALRHFREALVQGKRAETDWRDRFDFYARSYEREAADLQQMIDGKLAEGWDSEMPVFEPDPGGIATRAAMGKVTNATAPKIPGLIGGAADLETSTNTGLKDMGDFEPPNLTGMDTQGSAGGGWSYAGRNIHFGVREHAMGGILNGLAAHGALIPFGATFFVFSDYMRPPIRLASIMSLHTIYIFTHDSIAVGEDGPTHEPIEQLASLRAMPGIIVIRPGDANETAVAWKAAVESRERPVALILSRQKMPILDRSKVAPATGLLRGAYVLAEAVGGTPELLMIATGSEVGLAVEAQGKLAAQGIRARVVSMPSWEMFEAQPQEYRDSVLPPGIRARLAIEAASPFGWSRWVGEDGDVLGIDRFGASAPGETVMREYGFNVDNVVQRATALIRRRKS
ncbi:MAG TPA: transketolase [Chloroflexota bacterium]